MLLSGYYYVKNNNTCKYKYELQSHSTYNYILIDKNEQIIEESGNILKLKCLKNILQDPKKHQNLISLEDKENGTLTSQIEEQDI